MGNAAKNWLTPTTEGAAVYEAMGELVDDRPDISPVPPLLHKQLLPQYSKIQPILCSICPYMKQTCNFVKLAILSR